MSPSSLSRMELNTPKHDGSTQKRGLLEAVQLWIMTKRILLTLFLIRIRSFVDEVRRNVGACVLRTLSSSAVVCASAPLQRSAWTPPFVSARCTPHLGRRQGAVIIFGIATVALLALLLLLRGVSSGGRSSQLLYREPRRQTTSGVLEEGAGVAPSPPLESLAECAAAVACGLAAPSEACSAAWSLSLHPSPASVELPLAMWTQASWAYTAESLSVG
jgi:hypothetical protein